MGLEFWKLTGAGNDFVVLDNRTDAVAPDTAERADFIRRTCARGTGVGADGMLLVEPSDRADFRMRYYNSDGGEAETCGNGARCIARFAHARGIAAARMTFETKAGIYSAEIVPGGVRVSMSNAHSFEADVAVEVPGLFNGTVDFVNTGVPHVVVRVGSLRTSPLVAQPPSAVNPTQPVAQSPSAVDATADIETVPVVELGRALRFHERFAPAGANVNFVMPAPDRPNTFIIRTYERGVEDETLACGTGCIAAAVTLAHREQATAPVRLITRSGVPLSVRFALSPEGARGVELEGEARVVFTGELAE
jgi:diaminopimelate epimerase